MSAKVCRCERCGRRMRSSAGWNMTLEAGVIVGYLCPGCQTPEENAEAEINEATLDYAVDPFGRIVGRSKAGVS